MRDHAYQTISLVIPTISRASLATALASVKTQSVLPGDEVLVIGDGPQPEAARMFGESGLPGRYIETPEPLGSWGHGARNWTLEKRLPTCDVICNLDDDDTLAPNHFSTVRVLAAAYPGRAIMFRMRGKDGVTVWIEQELRVGNVGTPMLVLPNDGKWGRYGTSHEGDYDFISETSVIRGEQVIWRQEVIYHVGL